MPRAVSIAPNVEMLFVTNAAMIGFAVAGAFLPATYYPHIYILTGLFISAWIIVAKEAGMPQQNTPNGNRAKRTQPVNSDAM